MSIITNNQKINGLNYLIKHIKSGKLDLEQLQQMAETLENMPNVDCVYIPRNLKFKDERAQEQIKKTLDYCKEHNLADKFQVGLMCLGLVGDSVELFADTCLNSFTFNADGLFGGFIYHAHGQEWGIYT